MTHRCSLIGLLVLSLLCQEVTGLIPQSPQIQSRGRPDVIPLRASDREDGDRHSSDTVRRNLLRKSGALVSGLVLGVGQAGQAYEDFSLGLLDDGKVVLSTRTAPVKYMGTSTEPVSTTAASLPKPICDDTESRRISVFERTAPSVVFIDTFTEQRDAFSTNVMEVPLGAGSGFVWDDKGHIVTNYHVVRAARSAQIAILTKISSGRDDGSIKKFSPTHASPAISSTSLSSSNSPTSMGRGEDATLTDYKRSVYKARVVGVDPGKDIAVLKVDAPVFDLFPIEVGTSKGLRVGQQSLAIGNPFGLDHSLTAGIISGIGREVKSPSGRPISNVIQTDAAINPGNSGGPLLDSSGRLIGMNTAIYSPSGGSAGIGFAIPVDTVKYIVETLIRDGRVVRPILGISYLESKQARALGITKGVLVLDVPTNSPAYKSGMRGTRRTETGLIELGDIINKVEDTPINTEADLFQALEDFKPGDRVRVTVTRVDSTSQGLKSKEVVLTIMLKASSDMTDPSKMLVPYQMNPH